MKNTAISKATLSRIPQYLHYLHELSSDQVPHISATTIAKALNFGEVQVRKDLSVVSGAGRPRLGYETDMLKEVLDSGEYENSPDILLKPILPSVDVIFAIFAP